MKTLHHLGNQFGDRLGALVGGRDVADQLMRFAVAGGLSTVVYSAVYLPLTAYVFRAAQAVYAVPFAFAVAVTIGFFLHSRWSFKGAWHAGNRRPTAAEIRDRAGYWAGAECWLYLGCHCVGRAARMGGVDSGGDDYANRHVRA